jgi:hypothetical protein
MIMDKDSTYSGMLSILEMMVTSSRRRVEYRSYSQLNSLNFRE